MPPVRPFPATPRMHHAHLHKQRNAPLPNAVNLFNCQICDKGYPRQTDYENHLRSYDHNHRQRLAEMKKLTDANASDAQRPSKGPLDMRSIPVGDQANKTLGPRFRKVGGAGASTAASTTGGSRFKKVGLPASDENPVQAQGRPQIPQTHPSEHDDTTDTTDPIDPIGVTPTAAIMQPADQREEDEAEEEAEAATWEEYDYTKPSECDHQTCPGCAIPPDAVYEDGWLVMASA